MGAGGAGVLEANFHDVGVCGIGIHGMGVSSVDRIGWHICWCALGGHDAGGVARCQVEGGVDVYRYGGGCQYGTIWVQFNAASGGKLTRMGLMAMDGVMWAGMMQSILPGARLWAGQMSVNEVEVASMVPSGSTSLQEGSAGRLMKAGSTCAGLGATELATGWAGLDMRVGFGAGHYAQWG